MDEFSGMHILECLKELVDDELFMNFFKDTRPDDNMQVYITLARTCFHVIKDQIEIFIILCFYYIQKSDNVLVPYAFIHFLPFSYCRNITYLKVL